MIITHYQTGHGTLCSLDNDASIRTPTEDRSIVTCPYCVNLLTMSTQNKHRPLYEIAAEIRKDWKKVNYAAAPYLDAMFRLDKITDNYISDSGKSIVAYFLGNASSWRGDKAKAIKAELKAMFKA